MHSWVNISVLFRYATRAGYDVMTDMYATVGTSYLNSKENPVRLGNGHPNIVPYQFFPTADDPKYATNVSRVMNRQEVVEIVTNDSLQLFGSSGYSREFAAERHVRDARMFTIAGGTAQPYLKPLNYSHLRACFLIFRA